MLRGINGDGGIVGVRTIKVNVSTKRVKLTDGREVVGAPGYSGFWHQNDNLPAAELIPVSFLFAD